MDLFLRPYGFLKYQAKTSTVLTCVALGALFALGFPPFHHWYVSIISLSIFFNLFVNSSKPKSVFTAVFYFSLSYFSLSSYWVINTFLVVVNDTPIGYLVGAIALLVVASYMALFTAFCVSVSKFISDKLHGFNFAIVLIPLAWSTSEYLRSVLQAGQPMHYVGYMVGNNDYLIQLASLMNVYVVSFILVLVSLLLSMGYRHLIYGTFILTAVFLFGMYRVEYLVEANNETKDLKVRLVNANINQKQLLQAHNTFEIVDEYIKITQKKTAEEFVPELIIWPEGVLQFYIEDTDYSKKNREHITEFMSDGQVLITGGPRYEHKNSINYFTSMFQLNADGQLLGQYDKHRLVPWGEFLPFREYIPNTIANIFDAKDYTPGTGPLELNLKNGLKILPLLCAEGHFPQMLSEYQEDQDFIVMIGNEAWLEGTTEPSQFLVNARYRAVESGLPVLLTSNKGYLAIIDNKGIIKKSIYKNEASVLDGVLNVALNP